MNNFGVDLIEKEIWIKILIGHVFLIPNVHFVARGLDFHCVIFVFKGNTREIQGTRDKVD